MIGVQTHVAGLPHNLALRLEHAFNAAEIPKRLSARDERTVLIFDQRLHSHKEAPAAAACSYYLALYDRRGSQWTRRMIRQSNGTADLYQQLPEIMQIIFDRRKDPEAFRYIMEARLDGGPEEMLDSIREDFLLAYPHQTVVYLRSRFGTLHWQNLVSQYERGKLPEYIDGMVYQAGDDPDLRRKVVKVLGTLNRRERVYLSRFVRIVQRLSAKSQF